MVSDPSEPYIDQGPFDKQDWKDNIYREFREETNYNVTECHCFVFNMKSFVDSYHAIYYTNRSSRTGFDVYLNNAPIYWI